MTGTFKQKIALRDVPQGLMKPLPASLTDDKDISAAIVSNYETALDYFKVDRQRPDADQDLAFCLLELIFPAFDWPRRKKSGAPRTSSLKCRELYLLSKGVKLSDGKAREKLCDSVGLNPWHKGHLKT